MITTPASKGAADRRPGLDRHWRLGAATLAVGAVIAGAAGLASGDQRGFGALGIALGVGLGVGLTMLPQILARGARLRRPTGHDGRRDQQIEEMYRLEALGQLAGGVAHDFNNILTVIGIHGEFLLSDLDPASPAHDDALEIQRATQRASALTRQLLAFGRRQVLEVTTVNLNDVARNMMPMLRRLIGEDIDIRVRLAADIGIVRADVGQLQQLIMNLAVNARDAMPGGGTMTITTATVELDDTCGFDSDAIAPGRYAMLAVNDTGCGMTPEVRARIFDPFFTTKPPGVGTGLGLATVFGIVRQSGGYISVYSEVGEGSAFKTYLPIVDASSAPAADAEPAAGARGHETILLVEDHRHVRAVARRILVQHGYDVVEAASGPAAIAAAERLDRAVALLLTDVVLPDANGPCVVDRITARHPGAGVLYMSGYTDVEIARRGLAHAGGILQKPFSANTLLHAVRAALDQRPAARSYGADMRLAG